MSQRKSKQAILESIERSGRRRQHRDPELRQVADPLVSQRAEKTLDNLDASGVSSPDLRRRGQGKVLGFIAASAIALSPVGSTVSDLISDTGSRIDANYDLHNLPPGGQPLEYRQGVAYEPGTDNIIVPPEVEPRP